MVACILSAFAESKLSSTVILACWLPDRLASPSLFLSLSSNLKKKFIVYRKTYSSKADFSLKWDLH